MSKALNDKLTSYTVKVEVVSRRIGTYSAKNPDDAIKQALDSVKGICPVTNDKGWKCEVIASVLAEEDGSTMITYIALVKKSDNARNVEIAFSDFKGQQYRTYAEEGKEYWVHVMAFSRREAEERIEEAGLEVLLI